MTLAHRSRQGLADLEVGAAVRQRKQARRTAGRKRLP